VGYSIVDGVFKWLGSKPQGLEYLSDSFKIKLTTCSRVAKATAEGAKKQF